MRHGLFPNTHTNHGQDSFFLKLTVTVQQFEVQIVVADEKKCGPVSCLRCKVTANFVHPRILILNKD